MFWRLCPAIIDTLREAYVWRWRADRGLLEKPQAADTPEKIWSLLSAVAVRSN